MAIVADCCCTKVRIQGGNSGVAPIHDGNHVDTLRSPQLFSVNEPSSINSQERFLISISF